MAQIAGGLLLGILLAIAAAPYVGMSGFSERTSAIALGYACSVAIGISMGLLVAHGDLRERAKQAITGAALATLATYVMRGLPLPSLNLIPFDGTTGPAGELPLFVLPTVGLMLGLVLGGKKAP